MLTTSGKSYRAFLILIGLLAAAAYTAHMFYEEQKPDAAVTLAAVGDVLFARGVGKQIERHGPDWVFENVRGVIQGADLAFCNLECTLSTGGVAQRRRFQFRAHPDLARTLHDNGFDVVSLANNHTLDYGREALMDTVHAVRKAGLVAVGADRTREDALKLQMVEKKGLRIGFLAYTDLPSDGVVRLPNKPTVAGVNDDELPDQIATAKSLCDVLVVSFHWGVEYMKRPTERQRLIAHLCIDNGADLILGHHPHVLQPVEIYKDRPIIYSMGGFAWDARIFDADKSAIYLVELRKNSARVTEVLPVKSKECRPVVGCRGSLGGCFASLSINYASARLLGLFRKVFGRTRRKKHGTRMPNKGLLDKIPCFSPSRIRAKIRH